MDVRGQIRIPTPLSLILGCKDSDMYRITGWGSTTACMEIMEERNVPASVGSRSLVVQLRASHFLEFHPLWTGLIKGKEMHRKNEKMWICERVFE
jgi:hypothetical protein